MDPDRKFPPRWPVDLEATVAKNVRRLREDHGLSQEQLGSNLAVHGFGMHYTTVAQLEVGARPLRLNEVVAIAAYFDLPIESLWQGGGEIMSERFGAAQAADLEQMAAEYYTQQRIERLRDK
jgi:transcriptional regulator with XRE-family HTH domain